MPLQVLHIAVLRQDMALVQALLRTGVNVMVPNSRGWIALDEAVSLTNRQLVRGGSGGRIHDSVTFCTVTLTSAFDTSNGNPKHLLAMRRWQRVPVGASAEPCLTRAGELQCHAATCFRDNAQAEVLYFAMVDGMKSKMKAKRNDLLQSLADMPDHSLQVPR